jgi:serine/threonine-protein kinase
MTGDSHDDTLAMARPETDFAIGALFAGRYRIEGLLGAGGMGAVYAALDTTLDEMVALKLLRPPAGFTPELLERFRREVRLARRVTHRNVARTYDIGELGELHYLTMERVEGESLGAYMAARGPLPSSEVAEIAGQLCAGLAAAHAAGVIHRDLKPANILRDRDGRIVITDFGIARGTVDERDMTLGAGQLIGTPAYMAPEQVEGGAITPLTDLYALGLIVFEMLTGRQAFEGDSAINVAMARLAGPAPSPSDVVECDAPLARLVSACLARAPSQRPASAGALAEAFGSITQPDAGCTAAVSPATLAPPRPVAPTHMTASFVTLNPGQTAVAVLPFRYRGPPDDAYLSEVLTDELIDLLSMTRGLRVPSAGATACFADDRDPRVVGQSLQVDAVVDGSVQRLGTRLRVTARLVDATSGVQTFSEQVEGTLDDVFELQDRLAKRVAEALRLQLQAPQFPPISPEAAEKYLRARQRSKGYQLGGEGADGAIALYEECLAEAPEFGPALAGYALACARRWFFQVASAQHTPRDWSAACEAAVGRALEVAPQLAESHLAAARMHVQRGEYPAAAQSLQAALERAPTCGAAHAYLGMLQCEAGRSAEGLQHILLGVELDPGEAPALLAAARRHALHGDFSACDATLTRLGTGAAGLAIPLGFTRARVAAWRGDLETVRTFREGMRAAVGAPPTWGWTLASAYLDDVPPEELESVLRREMGKDSPRLHALMRQMCTEALAGNGHVDEALAHLAVALECALVDVDWLDRCPLLESLRGTRAFAECRAQVSLRAEAIWRLG